jgi:hypothetical protein
MVNTISGNLVNFGMLDELVRDELLLWPHTQKFSKYSNSLDSVCLVCQKHERCWLAQTTEMLCCCCSLKHLQHRVYYYSEAVPMQIPKKYFF